MRIVHAIAALTASIVTPVLMIAAAPTITPPANSPTVGRNLQVSASLKLTDPAPEEGLEITITSNDPKRLLLARTPHDPGSKSITIKVGGHYFETPDFYLHALDDKGFATYTATAHGYTSGRGTVKFGPSAILMFAPLQAPLLYTTPGVIQRVGLQATLIDAAGKPVERQAVAGGSDLQVELETSNPQVGGFEPSMTITIPVGEASVGTDFKPAGVGNATLSLKNPPGFRTPKQFATVKARVALPGIGVAGEIFVGKDLQVPGLILLGQPAPEGGLEITLTSSDPKRLVLSDSETKLGTGTLKIRIGASLARTQYYIQGLGDEGTVTYTASAPGYRDRVAPVYLAPSGIMIAYAPHGAPDEAEYLRKVRIPRPFVASLSSKTPEHIAVWTVYLDPVTLRGADMTAQRLRPGVNVEVELSSSDPAVGKVVPGTVKLDGSSEFYMAEFTPLHPGQTVITVNTPPGFLTPSNATSVTATVKE